MIEIKTVEGGADCRIIGETTSVELMVEGVACVGALVCTIANAIGEKAARACVGALKEILMSDEFVNAIIQEGIEGRRAAAQ